MARPKTPTTRGNPPAPAAGASGRFDASFDGPTIDDNAGAFDDDSIPTNVFEPAKHGNKPVKQPAVTKPVTKPAIPSAMPPAQAEPPKPHQIVAISMKTPADPNLAPVQVPEREMPHIKLRAMSEMSRTQIPLNLGNFAPPYNASDARKRDVKEALLWGCVAVILACGIALAVWFLAT